MKSPVLRVWFTVKARNVPSTLSASVMVAVRGSYVSLALTLIVSLLLAKSNAAAHQSSLLLHS